MILQWMRSGDLNISKVILKSESQFDYLFTLKNVYLSTNSYKFLNATNIAMKLMEYVAWILLCKYCKFGENITTVPEILNFS